MLEAFSMVGKFMLDDQASSAIDKVNEKAGDTSRSLKEKLGSGFATAGKLALGFGVATGAVVAGATALVKKVGEMADGVLDAGDRMLWSTDAVQQWGAVAVKAGIDAGTIETANKKLMKSWEASTAEGGKAKEAVEKLGLSYADLDKLSPEERFNAITASLADIEDPVERHRIGTELMGTAYAELAPAISMGADAMKDARDNANVFTPEQLQRANDMRIKFDQVKEKAGFLMMEMAMKLLPIFETFFKWVEQNMPAIEEFIDKAFTFIAEAIDILVPVFTDYLVPALQAVFEWIKEALAVLAAFWGRWGDDIMRIIRVAFDTIKTVIDITFNLIQGLFKVFVGLFTGDWQKFGDGLALIWDNLWEGMKLVFFAVWNAIVVGIERGVNLSIRAINVFINGINRAISALNNVPGVNLPSVPNMSEVSLPMLADGGHITGSGWAIVGEAGPELINLNRGAEVRPLDQTGGVVFQKGAFDGAFIMDDYGVDRLMNRVVERMRNETGLNF